MIEIKVDEVVRPGGKARTVILSAHYDGIKRYQVIFQPTEPAIIRGRIQVISKQRFDEHGIFECEGLNIDISPAVFNTMLRRARAILFE